MSGRPIHILLANWGLGSVAHVSENLRSQHNPCLAAQSISFWQTGALDQVHKLDTNRPIFQSQIKAFGRLLTLLKVYGVFLTDLKDLPGIERFSGSFLSHESRSFKRLIFPHVHGVHGHAHQALPPAWTVEKIKT